MHMHMTTWTVHVIVGTLSIQLYRDNVADLRLPVCEKSLYL